MRERSRPHEAKSRPFGGVRRAWGHVSRKCCHCFKSGPRIMVPGGWSHKRCLSEADKRAIAPTTGHDR